MATPEQVASALGRVSDAKSFVDVLLSDTLGWPIPCHDDFDDVTFEWTPSELGLGSQHEHLVIRQLRPTQQSPWGVFIVEFPVAAPLVSGRGMTGALRRMLASLVASSRSRPDSPHFQRDHLLFICSHDYNTYRIGYFRDAEPGKQPRLATFGWDGPSDPAVRTLLEHNLPRLAWPDEPVQPEEWVERWSSAFDVEAVTQRFYADYLRAFESLENGMAFSGPEDERRLAAQTVMNRLLFLRFVEEKGWLRYGGSERYLQSLQQAGSSEERSLFKGRLEPLFFEGLAQGDGELSPLYGSVPYLNGGLFERSSIDESIDEIPDAVLESIIGPDGMFYRYNFTVEESTPLDVDVAVDPEMLGRVFEELVVGRHESGSYYTPKDIVDYMCRECLKYYLLKNLKFDSTRVCHFVDYSDPCALSREEAESVAGALAELRAVDPACGSGAYLLGLLSVLYQLLTSIEVQFPGATVTTLDPYRLKLHLISHCIHGVDVDSFAANIARLRLWLTLAVDSATPTPLPNLDFKIEVGDSLLGPDPRDLPSLFSESLDEAAQQLMVLKDEYLALHSGAKAAVRERIVELSHKIEEELHSVHGANVIDWRVHFADVFFRRDGFDVVLANPPYVSAMEFSRTRPPAQRQALGRLYLSARGAYDLFVPFFERASQLLSPDGVLGFITPNKYLSASYSSSLRELVADRLGLLQIVDLSCVPVFDRAAVYPVLTFISREPVSADQPVLSLLPPQRGQASTDMAHFDRSYIPRSSLSLLPEHIWGFLLSRHVPLLLRLVEGTCGLLDLGSQDDSVSATTTAAEAEGFGQQLVDARDGSGFRVVNTGTIDPFVSRWGRCAMTNKGMRMLHPRLPDTCLSHRRREMFASPKVIFAKLASRCECFLDARGEYAGLNVNCFYRPSPNAPLEFLCAYANSNMFMFFYDQFFGGLRMQGGYYQFQAPQLRVIPALWPSDPDPFVKLHDDAVEAARSSDVAHQKEIQDAIDEEFYRLFGLDSNGKAEILSALGEAGILEQET